MSIALPRRDTSRLRIDTSLAIVNIVLLLIFFFLVTGQEARLDTSAQLSTTRALDPATLPSPVLEVIDAENWRLDGEAVLPEMVPAALAHITGPLHLVMDRAAPGGLLVDVLGRPELAGHEIVLVTLRESR